jgi:hypothetical protein
MDTFTTIVLTIISTMGSLFFGGLITWLVSRKYYWDASKELAQETARLYLASRVIIDGLEKSGLIKVDRDAQGNPTLVFSMSGSIVASPATASGSGTFTPP